MPNRQRYLNSQMLGAVIGLTMLLGTAPAQQPSSWMDQGAVALRQGSAQLAEEDFQHAITADPQSADAFLGLGLAQLRQGKADQAVKSFSEAISLRPAILSAHLFRGIALFQMNNSDEALLELRKEQTLQPKNTEVLNWVGIVELQLGSPDQAAAAFDQAVELKPGDPSLLYYQVRAHTLAAQQAFRGLVKLDADSALVHRAQAEIFSEAQQSDKAIDEYQAALKRSPGDPELYEALGTELQKLRRIPDAIAAYKAELGINPTSSIALFNLGKIQVEKGDPAEGVAFLRRALDAHATPAPTYFYLGFGLAKLNQNEEAAGWLERALASSPSDFMQQSSYYELARVYQRLGRKADAQHALEQLKKLKSASSPAQQQP